jgi:heat-inducible transcriptional repressor
MAKLKDSEKRKNKILTSTVELYLATAAPVGSSLLCKKAGFNCSAATIRNELAELEEMGLLTHPHTSAGRIPTDKGYRYYLDFLLGKADLAEEEKRWVKKVYEHRIKRLENIIEEASSVLAELTHYASIVSVHDEAKHIYFNGLRYITEQPEFSHIEKIRILFKLLEEREKLLDLINKDFDDDVKVYVGKETKFEGMDDCALVVSRPSKKRKEFGRLAVLGPRRMAYRKVIPLLNYISELVSEVLNDF